MTLRGIKTLKPQKRNSGSQVSDGLKGSPGAACATARVVALVSHKATGCAGTVGAVRIAVTAVAPGPQLATAITKAHESCSESPGP